MDTIAVKEIIARRLQTFREFEKAAEEMAGYASERLGMTITKKDVMQAFIDVSDVENDIPLEDLLFAACEKMDKEETTNE